MIGGVVWELCFGQFWSSLGSTVVDLTITFHGLQVSSPLLVLNGSDCPARVDLRSPLGPEEVSPTGTLTTLRRTLRPEKSVLRVMSALRDRTPDKHQLFELIMTYSFKMSEGSIATLRAPVTNGMLYDSAIDAVALAIYDNKKRFIAYRDTFCKNIKLEKGDFVAQFQVSHDLFLSASLRVLEIRTPKFQLYQTDLP